MFKVCYASVKGGVGKSSLTILLAKYIAQIKKEKVLVIDLDFQNSTSFHFVPKGDPRNIADALSNNKFIENIIPITDNLHILQSSLRLIRMQTVSSNSLELLLDAVAGTYDWCILDTHTDYSIMIQNALLKADFIITPVTLECLFNLKAAYFLKCQLEKDNPGIIPKWKLLFNRVRKAESENSIIHAYEKEFIRNFTNILETRIPETKLIGLVIDSNSKIANIKAWEKLYSTLDVLYTEINQNYRQKSISA